MVMVNVAGKEFYLDDNLRKRLDNIKYVVHKKNFDFAFIIDGLERIGKSTLGITCAWYLSEGDFTIDNIATDSNDAVNKIEKIKDGSVLLIDEGSLIFNSKDAMVREQKKIMKIINVVGQKNLIFIVVLPSIFDLNKQIAVRRTKFLIHCYADENLNRGRFGYFGEDDKRKLYVVGKKNFDSYQFPKLSQDNLGRFTDFNPLGAEYIETKKRSLMAALHEEVSGDSRMVGQAMHKVVKAIESYPFPMKTSQEARAKMIGISLTAYSKHLKNIKEGESVGIV